MELLRFRVSKFRSVDDSGWIEVDDVTALIGTNESGKTNLLLPLWKLNPAKNGEINPIGDYPRKLFNQSRNLQEKPIFVEAVFDVGDNLADQLAKLTRMPAEAVREVNVSRDFDGCYDIDFPKSTPSRVVEAACLQALFDEAVEELERLKPLKTEQDLRESILQAVQHGRASITDTSGRTREHLDSMLAALCAVNTEQAPKTSVLVPRFERLRQDLTALLEEISEPHPAESEAARKLVLKHMPRFVYYSNYGNLDSEIYLPHVIENLKRQDLGTKEMAKARTLRVLFQFVGLQPQEILELGRDFSDPTDPTRQPTIEEIEAIAEKKKKRSILLQSASALLTQRFREWWKQGDYRFRFEADGNHFRIWVSDDRRPEEVELENRSTGLQWFLSFYLVFLVESEEAHAGAILLLDEPGLSLHPLAQKDLSVFFDGLAATNQLMYTAHSPFLVDADRLERARKVYVAKDGTTKATADLRSGDDDPSQRGAGYAVLAALGLSVADSLLIGCTPVIVEGPSDHHYLGAMKNLLVAAGRLKTGRELVFPPAGGAKTVRAVASILGARDENLPMALFDSDVPGKKLAQELRSSLYAAAKDRVLEVGTFIEMEGSEIEDLLPSELIVQQLDRWQREPEQAFAEVYQPGQPIVPQIEAWAATHHLELARGWKVELAKRVKQYLLQRGPGAVLDTTLQRWGQLFDVLIG